MIAYTVGELVSQLVSWLSSDVWPGFNAYEGTLTDPPTSRPVSRAPFFVVCAQSGTYSTEQSRVEILIGIEVAGSGASGVDASACVAQLRNAIDALAQKLYTSSTGLLFGCLPGDLRWSIPEAMARPVWQATIEITFELPRAARNNGEFLC